MDDVIAKAQDYLRYCMNKDNAHYLAAERLLRWHARLGIPAVIAGAIVSTSIFATLERNPALGWKLATGLVALAAAVLAGLQTFLDSSQRAQKHTAAAVGYSQARRSLELFLLEHAESAESERGRALHELSEIVRRLDELDQMSLVIPTKLYDRAARRQPTGVARPS